MSQPQDIDARKYWRVAKQRLDWAQVILRKAQLPAAAQDIAGYAVECILKALLLTVTPRSVKPAAGEQTVVWLKRTFGHDLDALRAAIAGRGFPMTRQVAGEFVFVSTWDPESRNEPGLGDPARTARFLAAAEAIVKWADERI